MNLRELVHWFPEWLGTGNGEPILSSRVRLARNIRDIPFVQKATNEECGQVIDNIIDAAISTRKFNKDMYIGMEDLSLIECHFLVERRLVSPALVEGTGPRGVLVGEGEKLSIMVCEEDHLRIQCMHSGFDVEGALKSTMNLDESLSKSLDYGFSDRYGYLTACPSNTGTGLRASVLIHLPGLVLTRELEKILRGINQMGLTVRGFYGEGTEVVGNLFQISNQITLGQSEEKIVDGLVKVTGQIIDLEEKACQTLVKDARPQIEDKIWRSIGILKNARVMAAQEFLNLFSAVRLGVFLNLVEGFNIAKFNELLLITQPSHLQFFKNKELEPQERDIIRAAFIRERCAEFS